MNDQRPKMPKNFLRLTGIATQMGVIIFMGAYLGKFLDSKYPMEKAWFTIVLTILAVGISLFFVLRQVNSLNDKPK